MDMNVLRNSEDKDGFIQYNIPRWIEENKTNFRPPVCNKCLYNDQLTAFIVGGPNIRKDFHLEEGEEFFFQMKGDMCLKVVEDGVVKDVNINEGHVFLLPSRMLHSPQRFENTVGLVVERRRSEWEYDCLRYHVEGTTDILFERWIHLKDIVKDLPPIIQEYFESEAHRTGKPTVDSVVSNRPYHPDHAATTEDPLVLRHWIENRKEDIKHGHPVQLYGPPKYNTRVNVYGVGEYTIGSRRGDTFLYQIEGNTNLAADNGSVYSLTDKNTLLIPGGRTASFHLMEGYLLTVYMESPNGKREMANTL